MAKEKHVEGEADHYIKTLIGAVLGYAADGLDMFLLSFILVWLCHNKWLILTRNSV